MSKYLLDDHPLVIIPKLAVAVGLNEAIILQQINYWLNKSTKVIDGRKWTYNSYEDWQKQLPFWSISTLKRIFTGLEKDGLLISGNFNKAKFDKTKWYTIDSVKLTSRVCQVDTMESVNLNQPIPDTISDTSSDTSLKEYSPAKAEPHLPFEEIVSFLNEKAGTKYRASSAKTRSLIKARWHEGFRLDDFKAVITKKSKEWLNTDMAKYLRPETLFGTKFEAYLNQKEGVDRSDPWSRHYE